MGLDQAGYSQCGQDGIFIPVIFGNFRKNKIKAAQNHREEHHGSILPYGGSCIGIEQTVNGQGINHTAKESCFPAPEHFFKGKIADDYCAEIYGGGINLVGRLDRIAEASQEGREIQKRISVHDAHRIAVIPGPYGMNLNGEYMIGEPLCKSLDPQKMKGNVMTCGKVIQTERVAGYSEDGGQCQYDSAGRGIAFPEQTDQIQEKAECESAYDIFLVVIRGFDDADTGDAQVAFSGKGDIHSEIGYIAGQFQCQHCLMICRI